ncbi:MAG: GT4 family glycosyltransferase PelF [Streptosporangiaceae bacterium]|nr:GT4 family glycosyltransferase PelF [Streptosporangiaceae bacterium]
MRVALTAEGTYPHQFGGVSVWCDQLVRGLPDYDFTVVPLVATGAEPVRWKLPDNVRSMQPIPLWGPPPPVSFRARLSRGGASTLVAELIDVLLTEDETAQHRFGNVLIELFIYAQRHDLGAVLAGEGAVRALSQTWRERWPAILPGDPWGSDPRGERPLPTLNDAVTAMQLVEHAMRPLSHPPVHVDVVHAVTNGLGVLPALAAKWWYGLPMIVTEHGVYMREQYMHLRRSQFGWPVKDLYLRFLRRLCTLGYLQADVITPGNVYNRRWEAQLGADISRVRTVYNGVNPADFPALTDEPDVPTISWAGRIDPVKDLFTLLRAFALVVKQMPEARLRIFGSPPHGGKAYLQRCRAEAGRLGIGEQATFEGRVPEIRDAYRAGNVVVLSSIIEGFPYTLIEAMACGRPCVATDVGGVSEALADGAGLIVPPRNPAAMAEACLRLLRDQALRSKIGAVARAHALEHFTVDRAIRAFDEMYSLLGTGQPIPAARLDSTAEATPGRWIALPPDEESTVIMPALTDVPGRPVPPDQQATMLLPVLDAFAEEARR